MDRNINLHKMLIAAPPTEISLLHRFNSDISVGDPEIRHEEERQKSQ